jgi:hypothetical protein
MHDATYTKHFTVSNSGILLANHSSNILHDSTLLKPDLSNGRVLVYTLTMENIIDRNTAAGFDAWAKEISAHTGFVLGEKIYQGTYYSDNFIRNAIYAGAWKGKPAVLKVYDDPRLSDEPLSQEAFFKNNRSRRLAAPALYKYEMETPKRGWLIMERLPSGATPFNCPLNESDRATFVELYFEYRRNFPSKATRSLTLAEKLPTNEFLRLHVAQWFKMAMEKEEMRRLNGETPTLVAEEFLPRYIKILEIFDSELKICPTVWCHGHFKPQELFRGKDDIYYLTDFAHSRMNPIGFEPAFIIWADRLMAADWRESYAEWKQGIDAWLDLFEKQEAGFEDKNYGRLIRVNLIERALGTILADITASERPADERMARVSLLYRLIDDLI